MKHNAVSSHIKKKKKKTETNAKNELTDNDEEDRNAAVVHKCAWRRTLGRDQGSSLPAAARDFLAGRMRIVGHTAGQVNPESAAERRDGLQLADAERWLHKDHA